jgi:hypothetical protein
MKLDKKTMLKLMKEEYDKRLKHYLGEIEIKDDKRDVNLIKDAQGLKVKNEQGLELTIDDLVVIDNQEYVVLRMPEDPRKGTSSEDIISDKGHNLDGGNQLTSSMVRETDEDPEEAGDDLSYVGGDLRRKNPDMNYKRSIKNYDATMDALSGKKVEDNKVYVLITDFEEEYSL